MKDDLTACQGKLPLMQNLMYIPYEWKYLMDTYVAEYSKRP